MNKKRQKSVFNPFDATALFPYPQNTFLSDVFRGYRKNPAASNGSR